MVTRALTGIMAIAFAGCAQSDVHVVKREGEPDVHMVPRDDSTMRHAQAEARGKLPEFLAALSDSARAIREVYLKAQYTEAGEGENLWFEEVRFDERGAFVAKLANSPLSIRSVKYGDEVIVDTSAVVDWMFVEHDTLRGGYTWAVTRMRISGEDRKRDLDERDYVVPDRPIP